MEIKEKSKYFRIMKNDDDIVILAKQLAFITVHAIKNPFHPFFEDGNFTEDLTRYELAWNEEDRSANGEVIYALAKDFIEEYQKLSSNEKHLVFDLAYHKWDYMAKRLSDKLRALGGIKKGDGFCYSRHLKNNNVWYEITNEKTNEKFAFCAWPDEQDNKSVSKIWSDFISGLNKTQTEDSTFFTDGKAVLCQKQKDAEMLVTFLNDTGIGGVSLMFDPKKKNPINETRGYWCIYR